MSKDQGDKTEFEFECSGGTSYMTLDVCPDASLKIDVGGEYGGTLSPTEATQLADAINRRWFEHEPKGTTMLTDKQIADLARRMRVANQAIELAREQWEEVDRDYGDKRERHNVKMGVLMHSKDQLALELEDLFEGEEDDA